ncbi:hAT-like transposase, RNase-H fold [Sesbania bispinosa]|nr:hAT-like transposase, RNase-H fold [Sesbania bispinosa]
MRAHLMRCKDNPSKKQRIGSSTTGNVEGEVSSSPSITKFDQEASRDELVKMFVGMVIPFRQVENEAFRRFMSVTQPSSKINEMLQTKDASLALSSNFCRVSGHTGESINMLLLVASVLDPRYKLRFVTRLIDDVYNCGQTIIIKSKLDSCLKSIFEEYNGGMEESQGGSQETSQLNVQANTDRYELIAPQDVACSASIALDED